MQSKPKLIRITTVPISLRTLLKGQMKYMYQNGFEVMAITSGSDVKDIEDTESVPVITIEMTRQITPLKDLKAVRALYKLFKKEKPDIVHTHTPKAGIVGMMAAWLAGVPVRLHTVAGLPLLVVTGLKRKILNFVERLTYFFATKVYPNSKGLYDIILTEGFTSSENLKVIGNGSSNGIDTSHFNPDYYTNEQKSTLKQQYDIQEGEFVYVFVGRIVKDKGINELAQAFKKLCEEYNHVKLLIVGDFERELDPLSQETENILQENPHIVLTGFQKDVRPFLSISDALVFPSYREGFPNVVMQSGAMGLPCIVSDINGCNEIIVNDKNGIIIPVQDPKAVFAAMKRILWDQDYFLELKENARDMITSRYEQKILWQALKSEYLDLLNKVKL